MPDYRCQDADEDFIRENGARNYSDDENQRPNNARKTWRPQNPVLIMENVLPQENRTQQRVLESSDMQVTQSGRMRTNFAASNDSMMTSQAPNGYPASSFPIPSFGTSGSSVPGDAGALSVASGYQSCAAEALRYLVEEEGLSPDDPLVAGLRQHLGEQQRRLDAESIFRNYLTAVAFQLLGDIDASGQCDDDMDADLSDSEAEVNCEENAFHHLVTDMCDYGTKMHMDECDVEPEVRWLGTGPPSCHSWPVGVDYDYVDRPPSPAPSI